MRAYLIEKARIANGTRRSRILSSSDIEAFEQLFQEHQDNPQTKTIRVYASQGFVPNSYQYRCEISYIEARRTENGWEIIAATCDAKRSHGNGALVTINSRAA